MAAELEVETPAFRALGGHLQQGLRYGENPHQQAGFYVGGHCVRVSQRAAGAGQELSYNNINDTDAAFELVSEFDPPTARPVPSSNTPIRVAWHAVPICRKRLPKPGVRSGFSFGGIIAMNRPLDATTAKAITELFTESLSLPEPMMRHATSSQPRKICGC